MSKANSEGIKPDEEHQDANTAASSKRMNQQQNEIEVAVDDEIVHKTTRLRKLKFQSLEDSDEEVDAKRDREDDDEEFNPTLQKKINKMKQRIMRTKPLDE